MPTTEEIIQNYIQRRDRIAETSKRHSEELAPLQEAQQQIENYLLHTMNTMGVDSLKANGAGTAYRATSTSCQMADPALFKQFVFAPAVNGIFNYLQSAGYAVGESDYATILTTLLGMVKWDMVDFRAGKKGITEYVANEKQPVPGVNINTVSTCNIRRA